MAPAVVESAKIKPHSDSGLLLVVSKLFFSYRFDTTKKNSLAASGVYGK